MKKDIRRGEKEFNMMADLWRLYKNFYIPEDTDEYWTELIKAGVNFREKYDSKLADDLLMGIYDELESRYKQMFKGAIT